MLKSIFHIIFLLFSATLVNAESNSELFNKAVAAYKGNDFEKAITLNESLISKGCKTATLYFNLGNAYFKNGNIGKAMLNYERAERLAPNDEDIQHNLAFARLKTIDKVDPTKSFGAQAILKNTLSVLSSTSWCWISIALLWLTFGFALFFLFQNNHRGLLLFGGCCCAAISCITFFASKKQFSFENKCSSAIITQTQSYVKSAPDDSSTDLFQLHEGTKVEILDKVENYWKVKIADGRVGWMLRDEATTI